MNEIHAFLNFKLVDTADGLVISVADVMLVFALICAAYILSRAIEFFLARR